jgi:hypothetical protein
VRTGYGRALAEAGGPDARGAIFRDALAKGVIGVDATEEVARWIWENFAAVAGDQPGFECARECCHLLGREKGLTSGVAFQGVPSLPSLHEVLLSGWGCPIGELFDLEALAEHCEKVKRWSFFVTSEPCNVGVLDLSPLMLERLLTWWQVPGGVASPPNMLAIF